jgi:hypothetical protein
MLLSGLFVLVFSMAAQAQVSPKQKQQNKQDSLAARTLNNSDTAKMVVNDSLVSKDTTNSTKTTKKIGDIKTTVKYNASDSMVFDVKQKCFFLYKKGKVDYGDISLTADRVKVNWATSVMNSEGVADTAGKMQGLPLFIQGSDKYVARKIKYNFKSKKGLVTGIVTQQGEGYLHGENVKRNADNSFYVDSARYTTCNLEHPHFYIRSRQIKMMPGEKIITGPFNLYIADIPTPLGFLFGLFPVTNKQSAGIVIPSYGETQDRGFFLRDAGFYIPVKDYAGIKLLGTIYSKGSYGARLNVVYKRRYKYSGLLNYDYVRYLDGEDGLQVANPQYNITWTHTPETKRAGRFSATVNINSTQYQQRNSYNATNLVTTQYRSSIQYSYMPTNKPFNISAQASYNQNTSTKAGTLNLPNMSFSLNQINPFLPKNRPPSNALHKLNFRYTFNLNNTITNSPVSQAGISGAKLSDRYVAQPQLDFVPSNFGTFFKNADLGARHDLPFNTNFSLFKYFKLNPEIRYSEYWYGRQYTYTKVDDSTINIDTIRKFNRAYNIQGSIAATTQFYGTFFIRRGKIEAIRHTVIPSVSYTYSPDMRAESFGMFEHVNLKGKELILQKYPNSSIGAPSVAGRTSLISFGVNNTFEMKVKARADTGKSLSSTKKAKFEKVPLLRGLSITSSYNLVADSFKLAPFSIGAQTIVGNKFTFQITSVLDPYTYRKIDKEDGNYVVRRYDAYTWNTQRSLGRISNFTFTTNTSFNPKQGVTARKPLPQNPLQNQQLYGTPFAPLNQQYYVDFSIPWSLNVGYAFGWSRPAYGAANVSSSATFSGDVTVTKNWKISYNSSYDFKAKAFSATSLNITRDLHCWQMTMNTVPFGPFKSYNFTIAVKASMLSDLKLNRQRNYRDR